MSRQHVAVAPARQTAPVVRDLGSRNGTTLRGLALAGEVPVGDGIELQLGKRDPPGRPPLHGPPGRRRASSSPAGATVAPLGPARLGIGTWRLERAAPTGGDGWVELVTDDEPSAFLEGLALGTRISLLAGDALSTERGGDPVVLVEVD